MGEESECGCTSSCQPWNKAVVGFRWGKRENSDNWESVGEESPSFLRTLEPVFTSTQHKQSYEPVNACCLSWHSAPVKASVFQLF